MNGFRRSVFFCAAAFFLCTAQSCFLKPQERNIALNAVPDITYGTEWAVIIEPYASFRNQPSFDAETITHGRRGDVIQVTGKHIVSGSKKQSVWYQFEGGWLPGTSVSIYSNHLKALTASRSL